MSAGSTEALAKLPDAYRRWRSSRLGRITDAFEEWLILELVAPVNGQRILDAGCGDGMLLTALARRGAIATGIDIDPNMLSAARARAKTVDLKVTLVEGDIRALPFPDSTFDAATAVTVLCLMPDAGRAMCEIARVLRPGGRLFIGELGRYSLWTAKRRISGWLGSGTWRKAMLWSEAELCSIVRSAGLSIEGARGAIYYPPVS